MRHHRRRNEFGEVDYSPPDFDDGGCGWGERPRPPDIYSIDSLRHHDTHPTVLEWGLRRGLVISGEEKSHYGVVNIATTQVVQELRHDFLGYRDAQRALLFISDNSPKRRWAPGVLPLDLYAFFSQFNFVRDPIRLRKGRREWDDPVFADRADQAAALVLFPWLVPSVTVDGDVALLCASEPERVFARAWAIDSETRDDPLIPQYPIHRYRVDFYAQYYGAAVEIDGAAYHSSPEQVANDADRDQHLASVDVPTIRVAAADVLRDPAKAVGDVHRRLADIAQYTWKDVADPFMGEQGGPAST